MRSIVAVSDKRSIADIVVIECIDQVLTADFNQPLHFIFVRNGEQILSFYIEIRNFAPASGFNQFEMVQLSTLSIPVSDCFRVFFEYGAKHGALTVKQKSAGRNYSTIAACQCTVTVC